MVWKCVTKGRNIKPGDKVLKASKIDFIFRRWKASYEEMENG
jgi:hypothetical protein